MPKTTNLTIEAIEELPKEFLNAEEAAATIGISKNLFYRSIENMPFPILRIGREYRIPKKPFIEYLRTGRSEDNKELENDKT